MQITWNKEHKRWEARLQRHGVRKRFTSTIPGSVGKQEVAQAIRDFESGNSTAKLVSVEKVWKDFLADLELRSSSENVRNNELNGRLYILPRVGKKLISTVTVNDWQQCINKATKRDGSPLSEKSLKNIRGTIVMLCKYAYRCAYIENIIIDLYIPKDHPVYSKEILQPEEIKALLVEEYPSDWWINCWRFIVLTGLRPGEALGLQWSDIREGRAVITRSINKSGKITSGKNKNARRIVPLPNLALDVLKAQRAKTADLDSEWIFPSMTGDRPSQSTAFKHFKKTAEALGRPAMSPYGLRHTFVSMLSLAVPESIVKRIVGHSATMTTLETYAHHMDGDDKLIASSLDGVFSKLTS